MALTFKIRGGGTGGGEGISGTGRAFRHAQHTQRPVSTYGGFDEWFDGSQVDAVGMRKASRFPGRMDGYSVEGEEARAG